MDIVELVNEHEDRTATADRPFACTHEGCPKAFARKSDLVRHERIHNNERPWKCEWQGCRRDFIQRSALVVHMRTHTGERPHRCTWTNCRQAFSDSSSLARHRRIHTGKRPYECLVRGCGKTFCRKTTLTKHIIKNHPQYADRPEDFSLATFDEDDDMDLLDAPSPSMSTPHSPYDSGAHVYPTPHLEQGEDELPTPPLAYTYYQKNEPSTPDLRARARLHPAPQHDESPSAWSAPEYFDGYRAPHKGHRSAAMDRSVSHESQAYLATPPQTHPTRAQTRRRTATRRYVEVDEDDLFEDEQHDDGDDDYVDRSTRSRASTRGRRGAFASPASQAQQRVLSQHRYHHHQQRADQPQQVDQQHLQRSVGVARQLVYTTPSPQEQHVAQFSGPAPQLHHSPHLQHPQPVHQHHEQYHAPRAVYAPQIEYTSASPVAGPSSYPMMQSYTAPMPQTYTFEPVSTHAPLPSPRFPAPMRHRRASSAGVLDTLTAPPNPAYLSTSPVLPLVQAPSPVSAHAQPLQHPHHAQQQPHQQPEPLLGLGLQLGPAIALSQAHERRLSEVHAGSSASPVRPTFAFDDFDLPAPSPTAASFQFPAPTLQRRPSTSGLIGGGASGPAGQRPSFSSMTTRLLERMEDEQLEMQHRQASGLVGSAY
ncbi:hypothetical protein Rhopal_001282-T1 [Rhodotorula paludigena]|uniref:C2H2-type domain-containing protein n=1 Tax=Rhodotorula paludigena TaxID=86838 RepID=A0AAV5GG72_9BASI|nr:hypothetical protein Rhopal_001282-T1 [Rhodotorula paludigena]